MVDVQTQWMYRHGGCTDTVDVQTQWMYICNLSEEKITQNRKIKEMKTYYRNSSQTVAVSDSITNPKDKLFSIANAVKPVYKGHLRNPVVVVSVDRWSLCKGAIVLPE